jgi:SH3 domain protein
MQITVRTSPVGEARVVDNISSGESVTVLEENHEGWARVRTAAGREGWVLRRYLMDEKPAALRLSEMTPQDKNLAQRLEDLKRESQDARKAQAQAASRAQEAEANLTKLQADCAEVIKLRQDYTKLQEDCKEKSQALEEMSIENESLRFAGNIKWFLAGGGVLFTGWILGVLFSRRKRRWSSNLD